MGCRGGRRDVKAGRWDVGGGRWEGHSLLFLSC